MGGEGRLSKLFSNATSYTFASFLQSGVSFLLIPFYTRSMTKAEFGAMDQIAQAVSLLALISGMGLPLGLSRGFYLESADDEGRKKMAGTMYTLIGLLTVGAAGILFFMRSRCAPLLFGNTYDPNWFLLALVVYVLSTFQQIPIMVLKTLQRARSAVVWSLLLFAANAVFAVLFVVVFHKGLSGMLAAYCIGYGVSFLIQLPLMRSFFHLNVEFRRLRPLFAFGLPMLSTLTARTILDMANRFILPHYHGLSELATLTMATKITGIVNTLLLTPFAQACLPFIYAQVTNPDGPKLFGRLGYYMAILLCLLFLLIEAAKTHLIALLGGPQYADAAPLVTVVMIGLVFAGMQAIVASGIHLKKKIPQESAIMAVSSAVSVLCNFLLIPGYKSMGAAAAVAIGYFCFLVGSFVLAQKYYPVAYPYGKICVVFLCAAACWGGLQLSDGIPLRLVALAAYPLLITVFDRTLFGDARSLAARLGIAARKNRSPTSICKGAGYGSEEGAV